MLDCPSNITSYFLSDLSEQRGRGYFFKRVNKTIIEIFVHDTGSTVLSDSYMSVPAHILQTVHKRLVTSNNEVINNYFNNK